MKGRWNFVLQTHFRKRNRSADRPFQNCKPIYVLQNQGTKSTHRNSQHLKLRWNERQLSQQCLYRKAKCGHSFWDAWISHWRKTTWTISCGQAVTIYQDILLHEKYFCVCWRYRGNLRSGEFWKADQRTDLYSLPRYLLVFYRNASCGVFPCQGCISLCLSW